jgi:UDP-glucose 4-epimerase
MTAYSGTANYGPERAGDIKHSLADISLAAQLMEYKPVTGFEQGLARTVAWYRSQAAKQVAAR